MKWGKVLYGDYSHEPVIRTRMATGLRRHLAKAIIDTVVHTIMKFYMHSENPELTVVIQWDDPEKLIRDAINTFRDALVKKFPLEVVSNAHLSVKNAHGKDFQATDKVSQVVSHMGDLFVTVTANNECSINKISESVNNISIDCKAQPSAQEQVENSVNRSEEQDGKSNAAIIHLANGRTRKAILLYKQMLKEDQKSKTVLKGLVSCYRKAGRHKLELKYAKQGLSLFKDDLEFLMLVGEAQVNCRDGDAALETLMNCVKLSRSSGGMSQQKKLDLQMQLSKAYLLKNEKDMAITVLQGILRENLEHEDALTEYAAILFHLGPKQSEEAVSVILTVLARRQGDKRAKQVLAYLMSDPKGMAVLKEVAGGVMNDPAALVYLGSCLRDHSVVKEALELFKLALTCDPGNSSVALIHLHTLEIIDDVDQMLQFVQEFIDNCPQKSVGELTLAIFNKHLQHVLKNNNMGEASTAEMGVEETPSISPPSRDYSDDERYLLAFLFTVVKILYIKGLVSGLTGLISLLEPLYTGKELHQSNIRNEAAYFNCIKELLKSFPTLPSTKSLTGERTLYFIGDSHCLPAAWQKVKLQDREYLVQPILSTGTKIWHLRPDSDFYPRANFVSAIRKIPDKSVVVVGLGEIDCREALLQCWEKARYDKIEDGMEVVIQIYLHLLKSIQEEHDWTIFVHPVLPVLDLTRPIVMQFNRILATRLLVEPTLHWLNFVNGLLTEDESGLREEFQFDGTHIHPKYMSLLSEALAQYYHIL